MRGLYRSEDGSKVMVLSTGLGNTEELPRLNNIPEILVLDLLPGEGE
jgi:predicted MPP superfamily phosphohydrolase